MSREITRLDANMLKGPRSYFTDIDPKDPDYDASAVKRKLKLQLLTKERVVIAASSLFSDVGYTLFSDDIGLTEALERGVVVPAIREEFASPAELFAAGEKRYSPAAQGFFMAHATHSVPWSLQENSSWFRRIFYDHLSNPTSLLRQNTGFNDADAQEMISVLDAEVEKGVGAVKYLQREHIQKASLLYNDVVSTYLNNYANLIYRISGSRVVKSDAHFPQANLTKLGVAGNDATVSDESIFWDIYVESIISFIHSVVRLTPERLDELSAKDVLKMRESLFDHAFAEEYDSLIAKAKSHVDIHDPARLILTYEELRSAAEKMRMEFSHRVAAELSAKDTEGKEKALWQLGNALSFVTTPGIGFIMGILSNLMAIPEITSLVSKPLARSLSERLEWVRNFINTRVGWTQSQKRTLLSAYEELLRFGLPKGLVVPCALMGRVHKSLDSMSLHRHDFSLANPCLHFVTVQSADTPSR